MDLTPLAEDPDLPAADYVPGRWNFRADVEQREILPNVVSDWGRQATVKRGEAAARSSKARLAQ
jgi:hypothetical protein